MEADMDEVGRQRSCEADPGEGGQEATPRRRRRVRREVTPELTRRDAAEMVGDPAQIYYGLPTLEEARQRLRELLTHTNKEVEAVERAEALRQAVVFLGKHLQRGVYYKDGNPVLDSAGRPMMIGCVINNGDDRQDPYIEGFHLKYNVEYERPFRPLGWGPHDRAFDRARIRRARNGFLKNALLKQADVCRAVNFARRPNPARQYIDPNYIGVVLSRYNDLRGNLTRSIGITNRLQAQVAAIMWRIGAQIPSGVAAEWRAYSTDRKTPPAAHHIALGHADFQEWMNKIAEAHHRYVPPKTVVEIGKRRENMQGQVETTRLLRAVEVVYWNAPPPPRAAGDPAPVDLEPAHDPESIPELDVVPIVAPPNPVPAAD